MDLFSMFDEQDHASQWRLSEIQVCNWGIFDGCHAPICIDRKGTQFLGDSGSGKTTLNDAVQAVMTSGRQMKFNAAAGGRGRDRSLGDYIRGAYKTEVDETGTTSKTRYLRPLERPAWSAVRLRFERRDFTKPLDLYGFWFLKATETRDPDQAFFMDDDGHRLEDFLGCVTNRINRDAIKGVLGRSNVNIWPTSSKFATEFMPRLGIRGEETLALLSQTVSAKNMDSLDDMIRERVLEEPETFAHAEVALSSYENLKSAHDRLVDLREQVRTLQVLEDADVAYAKAEERKERVSSLIEAAPIVKAERSLELLEGERSRIQGELDHLAGDARRVSDNLEEARADYTTAKAKHDEMGGVELIRLEAEMHACAVHAETVKGNREHVEILISGLQLDMEPGTENEWNQIQVDVMSLQSTLGASLEDVREAELDVSATIKGAYREKKEIQDELERLRRHPTNIPSELAAKRDEIAREIGVDPALCPFVGELIDIEDGDPWLGAINRVLSGFARNILVPESHFKAFRSHVDKNRLTDKNGHGIRVEYRKVPARWEVRHAPRAANSLVSHLKITGVEGAPVFADWLEDRLCADYDISCVRGDAELTDCERGVTISGLVKMPGDHDIKDDRHAVDDPRFHYLGSRADARIAALEQDLVDLSATLDEALSERKALDDKEARIREMGRACDGILKTSWDDIDLVRAIAAYDSVKQRHETLSSSADVAEAKAMMDGAQVRIDTLTEQLGQLQRNQGGCERELQQVVKMIEGNRVVMDRAEALPDDLYDELVEMAGLENVKTAAEVSDAMEETVSNLKDELIRRNDALSRRRLQGTRAIEEFRDRWKSESIDFADGFDGRHAYLDLKRQIETDGLPECETAMRDLLNDFSTADIAQLQDDVRSASTQVRGRLDAVNSTLRLAEYAPGIHLEIRADDSKSEDAKRLISAMRSATELMGTDEVSEEERFERVSCAMDMIAAARRGTSFAKGPLDTRLHMTFYAAEVDEDGITVQSHKNGAGLSGGQKQRLVTFCFAAALHYRLRGSDDGDLRYGTVIFDEAFAQSDPDFTRSTLRALSTFGFHMILISPMRPIAGADEYLGGTVYVECKDGMHARADRLGEHRKVA